jgi:hypothetical protein
MTIYIHFYAWKWLNWESLDGEFPHGGSTASHKCQRANSGERKSRYAMLRPVFPNLFIFNASEDLWN